MYGFWRGRRSGERKHLLAILTVLVRILLPARLLLSSSSALLLSIYIYVLCSSALLLLLCSYYSAPLPLLLLCSCSCLARLPGPAYLVGRRPVAPATWWAAYPGPPAGGAGRVGRLPAGSAGLPGGEDSGRGSRRGFGRGFGRAARNDRGRRGDASPPGKNMSPAFTMYQKF